ncbi:MAG: FecR family protein, partial [Candidatus Saccharimonadales bacterium]
RILIPGEQAAVMKGTKDINVQKVNLDEVLAWKNGLFYFDNTNIKAIMQKVARWYNVTVIYQAKDLTNKNYSGILPRYSNVDALLKRMELTGTVHFQVRSRIITVRD